MDYSPLQKERYKYEPKLPTLLKNPIHTLVATKGDATAPKLDAKEIKSLFPHTYGLPRVSFSVTNTTVMHNVINIGVILSGGQAPGGHNVICGLYDALKRGNGASSLIGFLGGPSGILEDKTLTLTDTIIDAHRNTGGFDIIGSGRTKLETVEEFEKCRSVCEKHKITALVIIGGDDSNTNAAVLAEYFLKTHAGITVVGCPKTIDGDLKNEFIEASFGFDTATKIYSELIGNLMRDANSSKKYWHFIKLMGRSASHIALECALQTHPNVCLISEEIEQKEMSLHDIVELITIAVVNRAKKGLNYGIVLVPEGVVEFIPEIKLLINSINTLLGRESKAYNALSSWEKQYNFVISKLVDHNREVFISLPTDIQKQLLMDRDPHGNVQVSRIEIEKMFISMVNQELNELKKKGEYNGKFATYNHFLGYEGRSGFPSNFDADYTYSLGYNAYLLINSSCSGYISSVGNLTESADKWTAGGFPITMMMNLEERHGEMKPVIKKALVELDGAPFTYFKKMRDEWAIESDYNYPGPIQFFGPSSVCDTSTKTIRLEHQKLV